MKKILFLSAFLIGSFLSFGQCPLAPIVLNSQAEVDLFTTNYPACTELEDYFTISGPDITNLNALSIITRVKGGLSISNNPLLTTLNGLENLLYVGEENSSVNFAISNNASLTTLDALSNLQFVQTNPGHAPDLIIQDNPNLTDLLGLQSLGGYVYILAIMNNDMLTDLQGLEGFTGADDLVVRDNANLTSLNGFSSLTNLGSIILRNNDILTTMDGLTSLQIIYTVFIEDNPVLEDITELANVTIDPFNELSIQNNPSLSLCSINSICNRIADNIIDVTISSNDTGCDSIMEINAGCVGCPTGPLFLASQAEVNAFPTTYPLCTELPGGLAISGADITDLTPLTQITKILTDGINGGLQIVNNPLLINLDGLENITDVVDGDINVENNLLLTNINGFSGLNGFLDGYSLIIKDNPALLSLQGLHNITHPGDDDLIIWNNDLLVDLQGLNSLVGADDVLIWYNNNLTSLNGLDNFDSTGTFSIRENLSLTNLDGMPVVTMLFNLNLIDNPVLNDLTGLSQASLGTDNFIISGNPLLSLCSIESICIAFGLDITFVVVENNAPGCNSAAEVLAECTTISGFTEYVAGAWDNGAPDITKVALVKDNYTTGVEGSIDAKRISIQNGSVLTIDAGTYLKTEDDITVNGSLIVKHTANVVQTDATASVLKNGLATIDVELTTPLLKKRDFMVMGSPMDLELRNAVFDTAFLVLEHTPGNFIPHPGVPAGGTNFADDNNDFWNEMVGNAIQIGEGYIVRPQSGYSDPMYVNPGDEFTFDMTYSEGTLNNGDVIRSILYNTIGNPDGTPNVLANPYPSAIDATLLITDLSNTVLNEIYFWEHLTSPSTSIPGAGNINFSMDDISMFNGIMGIPAANDPGTTTMPNGIISTGQGFGIKAFANGTVTFKNSMRLTSGNTTLRTPENVDKLLLKITNEQYDLGGYAGIAFSENATADLDPKFDSNRLSTSVSLYSHLDNGTEQFGIQSRDWTSGQIKIPLGFSTQIKANLEYVISIASLEGLNLNAASIKLLDNETQAWVDLKTTDYHFTSAEGTFNELFLLLLNSDLLDVNSFLLDRIKVFPNPVSEILQIEISDAIQFQQAVLFSVVGKSVLFSSEKSIDVSNLSEGIYFLRIETSEGSIVKKIVKQ